MPVVLKISSYFEDKARAVGRAVAFNLPQVVVAQIPKVSPSFPAVFMVQYIVGFEPVRDAGKTYFLHKQIQVAVRPDVDDIVYIEESSIAVNSVKVIEAIVAFR